MHWEYKIVYCGVENPDEEEYEKRLHTSEQLLNKFGEEGWELVGFLPRRMSDNVNKYHAVFKRVTKG
jgi:Domain of unknown function (DUF4177)